MTEKTEPNTGETAGKDTRFKPGNSGKPKGARNRRTAWLEEIDDDDLKEIRKAMIGKAKEGDVMAARIIYERLWPAPKARKVEFQIPDTSTAEGVSQALAAVTAEMAAGNIDPSEAQQIAAVFESQRRAIEVSDHAVRLAAIEDQLAKGGQG